MLVFSSQHAPDLQEQRRQTNGVILKQKEKQKMDHFTLLTDLVQRYASFGKKSQHLLFALRKTQVEEDLMTVLQSIYSICPT